MQVNMTIHLIYNREKDGTLTQFREKYEKFKSHITRMQANGSLPVGMVRWSVKTETPTPTPEGPAMVGFRPHLVHKQGAPLEHPYGGDRLVG